MSIVKSGFASSLREAEELSVDQVLDIIEFEDISADIEHYQMENAKNGGS